MQLGVEIAAELCLSVAGLLEVCRYLTTDIGACIVHWDAICCFARKLNLSEVARTGERTATTAATFITSISARIRACTC
jgi:hypothetical protein